MVQLVYCIGRYCDDATACVLNWLARIFSGICIQMLTQYTTANTLKKLLKRALVKKSGAGPGGVWRSVHNRTNLAKVTPVPEVSTPIQYTTAQTLRKLLRRTLVKKSGPVPGPERVSGGQYTDSVHNRTNLKKVTQAYFSQEKRGSPWSREGVRKSVHRFSTQPHKICLGVDLDGSVHNCSELIVTQAYFKRKASSVLHLRSMHFALVPGGV